MIAVLSVAWALGASPLADYERGGQLFKKGRVEEALAALDAACSRPDFPDAQLNECLRLQAFSLYMLVAHEEARVVYESILARDPEFRLDPIDTPPEFLSFFGRLRPPTTAVIAPSAPTLAARVPEGEPPATTRGCGVVLCLIPFGVGQFGNDAPVKGVLFAAVEAAALGLNLGLYWSRVTEHNRLGRVADVSREQDRLLIQQIAGGVLIGAIVLGVVDAFVFY